jgi:hypothetical protein
MFPVVQEEEFNIAGVIDVAKLTRLKETELYTKL